MTGTAAAQDRSANDTEEADVTVGVSETIAVDIQPANLNYPNAEVGNRNDSSERGFGAIEIHNSGSTYINRIWLNTSVPQNDPYGTGDATDYDAGNFLEVQPTGDLPETEGVNTEDWNFVNRKEFLWKSGTGEVPSFIQTPTDASWDNYYVAPLRRGNETIYTAIQTGDSSTTCDGGNSHVVRVGNVSATDSRLGTVDFTASGNDNDDYGWREYTLSTTSVTGSPSYGVANINLNWTYTNTDGDLSYDLLTHCGNAGGDTPPNAVRTSYNVNAEGTDSLVVSGSNTDYLLNGAGTTGDMLKPGSMVTVDTAINVPEGVAAGSVDPGTLRVLITADKSQTP